MTPGEARHDGSPCMEWTGAKNHGYGVRRIGGRLHYLHRLTWEQAHGPIPDGMQIDHLCRNVACYRLSHLELVTPQVNVRRSGAPSAWNGVAEACPRGHPYDAENTYLIGGRRRDCLTCRRVYSRAFMRARRSGDPKPADAARAAVEALET